MNRAAIKIAVLLPHTRTYGGVRRYVEMGNRLSRRGYDYVIYTPDDSPPDWIRYDGRIEKLDALDSPTDVLICGDVGMLPRFADAPARLKIMNLLGSRFADKYRRHYRKDMVVVGNSVEWKKYFPGVEGYTIAGAVNTDVFHPMPDNIAGTAGKRKKGSKTPGEADFVRRPLAAPTLSPCVTSEDASENIGRESKEGGARTGRVMCFGRREKRHKGTRFVIDAMRRLKPRREYALVMFDNEPQRKPWFVSAEMHHGLTQERLAALYNTADVFVSAEYGAGWSNTSAEAAACGVPLICTDSGTQDFAVDGETALVVPHEDPAAIARAIERIRQETVTPINRGGKSLPLSSFLAENALKKIREFTWERLCDRFESLFAEKGLTQSVT